MASKPERVSMKDTMVTLDGVERRAEEHARLLGINWETVKQRRNRGCNWKEALSKGDKRKAITVSRRRPVDNSDFNGSTLVEARENYLAKGLTT